MPLVGVLLPLLFTGGKTISGTTPVSLVILATLLVVDVTADELLLAVLLPLVGVLLPLLFTGGKTISGLPCALFSLLATWAAYFQHMLILLQLPSMLVQRY